MKYIEVYLLILNAIKCNLMELTTRSTSHPLCGQQHFNMSMYQDSMCSSPECVVALQRLARLYALAFLCAVGAPIVGCPTPPSLPFSTVLPDCVGCLLGFPSTWGLMAGLPVARICQPWEWSPSRSWLPIVEAPGCFRHPTSTLRGSC